MRNRQPLIALTLALALLAGAGTSAGTAAAQGARDKGSKANTPQTRSGERKMTRSDPEWQDVQDALDILDKEGKTWVRKCVEDMMNANNISLDSGMDEIAKYSGVAWGPEEMYLKPSELPSGQHRRDSSQQDPGGSLAQQAQYYKRLVSLAGTLLHECKHRKTGLLGRAANYWGSKIAELSLGANGEEALTHHSEFLFYYGLFTSAQLSGTECLFLKQIISLMEEKVETIEELYSPFSLLAGMKKMLKERKAEYEKICGGSSEATVVDGFWDEKTDSFVGTLTRYHDVDINAFVYCDPNERKPVGGRVHGWPLRSRPVKEGGTLTLTPPPTFQDAVLESVLVNGKPVAITNGKVSIKVTGKTRIEFRYRCKKDLAAGAAAERAALQEQARTAQAEVDKLENQEQALEDLDEKCKDECDKIRAELDALKAKLDQAKTDLKALNGQLAQANADAGATQKKIDNLNKALDDWNKKTPEERDAERRQAAQEYEQASRDAAAERAAAAQELQGEWESLNNDRSAAAQRGSGHYFGQLPGFRARSRAAWDKYKAKTDAANAKVKDAWNKYKDADVGKRHDREMPGLKAKLAGQKAAVKGLEVKVKAKEGDIAALEAKIALLEQKLRLCMDRWDRVRDQLGLVSEGLDQARAHRDQVRETLGASGTGTPTPEQLRNLRDARKRLAEEAQRLRSLLSESEEAQRDLQNSIRVLEERLRQHNAEATRAGNAATEAENAARGKRDEAGRLGAALAGDPDELSEEDALALRRLANMYRFWQEALLRSLGGPPPAADGSTDAAWRAWEFAWQCWLWEMEGWQSFHEEAEAFADDAATRAAARDDPGAVRRRQATLNQEADVLDRQAASHRADEDVATGMAAEARARLSQVEQEALIAGSFAFEAMFALAMLDAELAAMDGVPNGNGSRVEVELRGTGETTGHVADARVTNLGNEVLFFVLERGLTLRSGSDRHSDVAVTEQTRVEVPPGETRTVPVQGCSLDPDSDTAPQGEGFERGEVSGETVAVLDATDGALADQGLEPTPSRRATVAQWALWRNRGVSRDEMTVAAVMDTLDLIAALEGGDLGDVLGGLLGANSRRREAQRLMDAVDAVVESTAATV